MVASRRTTTKAERKSSQIAPALTYRHNKKLNGQHVREDEEKVNEGKRVTGFQHLAKGSETQKGTDFPRS